jgi:glycosyltransferase involved in cell wall biosynthesis
MSRRTILFLIPSLRGGGAERVILTLLRHVDRSKYILLLAVVDLRGAAYAADLPEDVELIDLQSRRVRYAMPRIIRLIWRRRPDVVLSTLGHLNLALAIVRRLLPNGITYIARETSLVSETIRGYKGARFWRLAYQFFYSDFDRVVCQSTGMKTDLVRNFGTPAARAVVVHNPVDLALIRRHIDDDNAATSMQKELGNDPRAIQLVSAGRLSHEKGFDILIDAVSICNDPRIRLTLLGEGSERTALEERALAKGVAGQIQFVGFQRNPYRYFAQADAYIMSSRHEGFPNVVLEALACGTPVIATPALGGLRELLEGVDGCLIAESVSGQALAEAISKWSRLPLRRIDSELVVRNYSAAGITREYETVFDHRPGTAG